MIPHIKKRERDRKRERERERERGREKEGEREIIGQMAKVYEFCVFVFVCSSAS